MLQVITYIDESDCVTKREKQLYEIALDNQELSECYDRERKKSQEELETRKEHILTLCSILDEFQDSMDHPEYEAFKAIRKDYIDTNIE